MLPYASIGRRVAVTQDGYFVLVPPETRQGDAVYFLDGGGSLGYVLRRKVGDEEHEFIWATYVHGFYGIRPIWRGGGWEKLVVKLGREGGSIRVFYP